MRRNSFIPSLLRHVLVPVLLFLPFTGSAQIGGSQAFDFLNLVTSARIGAVGGYFSAVTNDDDLSLAIDNPSLLHADMEKRLVFDYVNYFSDINFGSCAYAHHLPGWGTLSAGMRYVDYGSFQETNEQGDVVGSFRASDMAFQLGTARAIDSNFTAGVNARFIYSSLAGYTSSGVAADLAVTYRKPQGRFAAALLLRNVGVQVNPYVDQTREKLPYEVQIAISQKLEHLPFRYIVHFTQLQKLDLNYENSNNPTLLVDPLTGESIEPRKMIGDKIMRHVVLGGELSPSQNFHIRFGYNYRRRQELKVDSRAGTVGFSWGFGLKISKFQLNYGRATYHLAGASNHFSVSTRISDFIKKEEN